MSEVTQILSAIEHGDANAAGRLLPLVYDELRKLAAQKMGEEKPGQTLQATALVHEAYMRLVDSKRVQNWNSRGHFFAAAAEAMRRILVEKARSRSRQKHGGGWNRQSLDNVSATANGVDPRILAVDEALTKFAETDPVRAQLVKLRFFGGLTLAEIAAGMNISTATAERHWRYARAWLARELRGDMLLGDS